MPQPLNHRHIKHPGYLLDTEGAMERSVELDGDAGHRISDCEFRLGIWKHHVRSNSQGRLRPFCLTRPAVYGGLLDGDNSRGCTAPFTGLSSCGFSPGVSGMSKNYYSEINLHLVWHTKLSLPPLSETIEPLAWAALREKAVDLGDVVVHEIGGIDTHIHLAVSIEPTVLISELVGTLKGYASHEVNRRMGLKQKVLQWQTGYGVVSFGTKDLPWVSGYIRGQRDHHARGTGQYRRERIHRFDDVPEEAEADEEQAP